MSITFEQIESTVNSLPIQHRTMLRLLLLQYLDVKQDEVEHMAADQPDSRFMAGAQPTEKIFSREAVQNIADRANQYRLILRHRRERPGLQIDCIRQLLHLTDLTITVAERLLTAQFDVDRTTIDHTKAQAATVLAKQVRRKLDRAVEQDELSESGYKKDRLLLEYQLLLRKKERLRRRLTTAQREFQSAGLSPLQDHEIAHIWGIPLGSLSARKVKALHQYLKGIEQHIKGDRHSTDETTSERTDYWKETFSTLWRRPVERSVVEYDGLERTEEALMEKLGALVSGSMSEEEESKFWIVITKIHDSEHSGVWKSHSRSIFALQRLSAIMKELDQSEEAIEEDLVARIAPPIAQEKLSVPDTDEQPIELNEEALGVLQKMVGEVDDKRRG